LIAVISRKLCNFLTVKRELLRKKTDMTIQPPFSWHNLISI